MTTAKRRLVALAMLPLLLLTACAENPTEGQLWGTGAGAVAGGAIGRAAAIGTPYPWGFTGIGLVAGAAMGYAVGDHVDPQAQRLWAAATVQAAESGVTGQPVRWESRGHHGTVTALAEAQADAGGRHCRPLRQEASRLDEADPPYRREVKACRLADGTWEVMEPFADAADNP